MPMPGSTLLQGSEAEDCSRNGPQSARLFGFFSATKQSPGRAYANHNAQDCGERQIKAARVQKGLKSIAHALALPFHPHPIAALF
jgi:hypothetical protein